MSSEKNRIERMELLRDHLSELFELCGIKPQKVDVTEQSVLVSLLEMIIKDKSLYSYLEVLDTQSVQAIRKMEERKLDDWNSRQNEKFLEQLQQEKEELLNRCSSMEKELEAYRDKREEQGKDVEALQMEQLAMIKSVISMRDDLCMRASWIESNAPEETAAAKLVETQLKGTARLLQEAGVEIAEEVGVYDSSSHTVVGTAPAPSSDQIDHIAKTVRAGYRFRGENLRSQEVILYVGEEV